MKTKQITFQQDNRDSNFYVVDKLINCVEPKVGSKHTEKAVSQFCQYHNLKVIVNRAKR